MRRFICLLVLITVGSLAIWHLADDDWGLPRKAEWDLKPPRVGAMPVITAERLASQYSVGSRIRDRGFFGEGGCDNWPLPLKSQDWGEAGKISLVIDPEAPVAHGDHLGIAVRVVNRSDHTLTITACGARLPIVQEALDENGRWCEIENPPTSFCGNSYSRAFLRRSQYWEFTAPTYGGPLKTRLRFRLDPDEDQPALYSVEFDGQISAEQLRRGPSRAALRQAVEANDVKVLVPLMIEVLVYSDQKLRHPDFDGRQAALELAKVGPAAKEALPALHAAMTSSRGAVRVSAAYAAWSIEGLKPEQMKTLIAELSDKSDEAWRYEAVIWLGKMGQEAEDAVPTLVAALDDPEDGIKRQAATALASIGARADLAVPALAHLLHHREWIVRYDAAEAIGRFGATAKSAVSELKEALNDRPDEQRQSFVKCGAAKALWRITCEAEPGLGAVIPILERPAARPREAETLTAIEVIESMGAKAEPAISALLALRRRADRDGVQRVDEALSLIDPDGVLRKGK